MNAVDVIDVMRKSANASKVNAETFPESRVLRAHAEDTEQARAAVAELMERLPDPDTLRAAMLAGSREYAQKWRESVASGHERRDFYDKSLFLGLEADAAAAALARCGK